MLDRFFPGDGEMARRMRDIDWSRTPLGPVESWSPALRTMLRILLANRFPHVLWWGPEYIQFYNDAYRPIPGSKHPERALGRPARECWPEIWHVIGPLIDTPFQGGPATWDEDIFLEVNRHGFVEETHFTIAYSPVPDDAAPGGIGGVLATVHEITDKVVGERRVMALRDLGTRAMEGKTAEDAGTIAAETLAHHAEDVPFALLYLIEADGTRARLVSSAGVAVDDRVAPPVVDLGIDTGEQPWPLSAVVREHAPRVVEDLAGRLGTALPAGPWADPPRQAMVVPVRSTIPHQLAGILVAGVSARLRLDQRYRGFYELIAGQIAAAIANAGAYAEERKRAEALAAIDRAKTAFFSNVSHEFRTPLTLMLGPVDDILARPAEPRAAEDRQLLTVVHRNGLRLQKLVNALLDFSRIEAGRVQAVYEPTDLAAVTAELASNFRSACERAGLGLVTDCPSLAETAHVDREMWEKIVLNLVSNAFKFTLEGHIAVRVRGHGDHVVLTVSDTGTGIPATELPRIFERFHRVRDARARSHEGTGIGLALVHELVRLHGGTIAAASEVGRGTTFTVSIRTGTAHLPSERIGTTRTLTPTASGAEAYVAEALRWLPARDDPAGGPGGDAIAEEPDVSPAIVRPAAGVADRVLVVEDNADMREYLCRLLGRVYEVDAVSDGDAALQRIRTTPPHLVLADVMMPGLDGFGLLAALRADERTGSVPVILLSARAGEEARIEGLHAGADAYLVKPFSARDLLACVASQLQLARQRREAEQALRYRSEQYETLLNQAPLGVYLVDGDFRIREVNPVALPVFGEIPGGVVGRDFDEIMHLLWEQRYADEMVRIFRHTLQTGEPYITSERAEFRIDRGLTEYYTWRLDRITLPDGRFGVVCYFRDISAEVFARERSTKLTAFSGELARAVTVEEVARTVCHWARELVGADGAAFIRREGDAVRYVAENAIGPLWAGQRFPIGACISGWAMLNRESAAIDDIDADARIAVEAYRPTFVKALLMAPVHEVGRVAAGGPQAAVGVYWARRHRASVNQARMLAAVVDAASVAFDRARLITTAEASRRSAERDSRAKDEFMAMLGHELRNPVGALASAARVLNLDGQPPATAARARDVLGRQIDHLAHLVDDLLDVSRLVTAKVRLTRRPLDLAQAVRDTVEGLRTRGALDRHRVTVVGPSVWIDGDETRLEQIVTNLVGNATKFTPPGGEISVTVAREESQGVLEVRDTGVGIAAETLATIFDLFAQGERTLDRAQGGLGIGLTLVRRLVELHGGSVEAASDGPGRGSVFTVRLPTVASPGETVQAPSATRRRPGTPRRILVVEDNPDAREMLCVVLAHEGHDVHEAADGPTGLDAAASCCPDVALIDVGLPGLDGYEVARRIRASTAGEPPYLIAITGYGQPEDRRRAREAGFDTHLVKPIDPIRLAEVIATAAARPRG